MDCHFPMHIDFDSFHNCHNTRLFSISKFADIRTNDYAFICLLCSHLWRQMVGKSNWRYGHKSASSLPILFYLNTFNCRKVKEYSFYFSLLPSTSPIFRVELSAKHVVDYVRKLLFHSLINWEASYFLASISRSFFSQIPVNSADVRSFSWIVSISAIPVSVASIFFLYDEYNGV